jgi:hypothetical protein
VDAARDTRSLGQLVGDLTRQLGLLFRQEIELARVEVTSRASEASRDAALVGVGGAVLYAGFLGLSAALVLLLVEAGLNPWIAALIVGIVLTAVGAVLIGRGLNGLRTLNLAPRRTMETIRDDAEWAKEQIT